MGRHINCALRLGRIPGTGVPGRFGFDCGSPTSHGAVGLDTAASLCPAIGHAPSSSVTVSVGGGEVALSASAGSMRRYDDGVLRLGRIPGTGVPGAFGCDGDTRAGGVDGGSQRGWTQGAPAPR